MLLQDWKICLVAEINSLASVRTTSVSVVAQEKPDKNKNNILAGYKDIHTTCILLFTLHYYILHPVYFFTICPKAQPHQKAAL